jgi:roadblock/LC7 domain-containing protein
MATVDDLLKIDGVVAAGEFTADGCPKQEMADKGEEQPDQDPD